MARPCACDRFTQGEEWKPGDCRLCWLYHNDPRYRELWDSGKKPQFPSFLRQATNFAGAVVRHVAAGLPTVSEEEKGRRMALCLACEHYVDGRCALCGCFTAAKAAWAREKCPVGKW
jgi:hypothetical protein